MVVIRVHPFMAVSSMRVTCLLDRDEQRPRAGSTLVAANGGVLQVEEVVEDDTARATDRVTLIVRAVPAEGEKPWAPYRVHEGYVLRELRDKDVSPSPAPDQPRLLLRVVEVKSAGAGYWHVTVEKDGVEEAEAKWNDTELTYHVPVRRLSDGEPFELFSYIWKRVDERKRIYLVQPMDTTRVSPPCQGDLLLVMPDSKGVEVIEGVDKVSLMLVQTYRGPQWVVASPRPDLLLNHGDILCRAKTYDATNEAADAARSYFETQEAAVSAAKPVEPQAVPMILSCPVCHGRHIDRGAFATKPHHTHACQHCGVTWRPAIVPTVGVQFLPGFRDEES